MLFASAERDLLACYARLLSSADVEVDTAFDGTQAVTKLAAGGCCLLILDQELPRIGFQRMIEYCNERQVPVIGLLSGRLSASQLLAPALAAAYLMHPFSPQELREAIDKVLRLYARSAVYCFDGIDIPVNNLLMQGQRLTVQELELLEAVCQGRKPEAVQSVYLHALNEKLHRSGLPLGIRYQAEAGYRMVRRHE